MGVKSSFVTLYGIKAPFDHEFNEYYHEVYENDLEIIFDGMSGEYMLLGHLIAYMDPYRNNDMVELDLDHLVSKKARFIETFERQYPDFKHLLENKEWKIISLIHYH